MIEIRFDSCIKFCHQQCRSKNSKHSKALGHFIDKIMKVFIEVQHVASIAQFRKY